MYTERFNTNRSKAVARHLFAIVKEEDGEKRERIHKLHHIHGHQRPHKERTLRAGDVRGREVYQQRAEPRHDVGDYVQRIDPNNRAHDALVLLQHVFVHFQAREARENHRCKQRYDHDRRPSGSYDGVAAFVQSPVRIMRRLFHALDAEEDAVYTHADQRDPDKGHHKPPHLNDRLVLQVKHHELYDGYHPDREADHHVQDKVQGRVGHYVGGTRQRGIPGGLEIGEERDVHGYSVACRSHGARDGEDGVEEGDGFDARGLTLSVEVVENYGGEHQRRDDHQGQVSNS